MRFGSRFKFVSTHRPPDLVRLAVGTAVLLTVGRLTWAQAGEDPLDRSMAFVEKTAQATELFNTNQMRAALEAFRSLEAAYPDLDEDGFVALSIGDCLSALGQYEEARSAYAALLARLPNLRDTVREHLLNAELLSGNIRPETLDELRQAGSGPPGDDATRKLTRLGWALEKSAQVLLTEAVQAFRSAAATSWLNRDCPSGQHALLLDEINNDLKNLIAQTDAIFGLQTPLRGQMAADEHKPEVQAERRRIELLLKSLNGKRFDVQIRPEASGESITVNGKLLVLTEDEKRIIQRHEERIYALLLQAAKRTDDQ